jgi:hypothetical protein
LYLAINCLVAIHFPACLDFGTYQQLAYHSLACMSPSDFPSLGRTFHGLPIPFHGLPENVHNLPVHLQVAVFYLEMPLNLGAIHAHLVLFLHIFLQFAYLALPRVTSLFCDCSPSPFLSISIVTGLAIQFHQKATHPNIP